MSPRDLLTDAFLSCRAQLARVVSRIVPPQDIEDIVQATYVRVCQYNSKNSIDEPRALMLSVARNLALDHVKRADYRLTEIHPLAANAPEPKEVPIKLVSVESAH